MTVPELLHLGFVSEGQTTSFEGLFDGRQQHVVIKRFGEEFDGAALHRLDRLRYIAVTGDEDDWHVGPFDGDTLLQFETIETRKGDIQNEATRNNGARTVKEFLGRGESLWLPTLGLDQ